MNHEISFSGLAALPAPNDAPDGQLATSINLIAEDAAIRPVPNPAVIAGCPDGFTPFIHATQSGTRLIMFNAVSDSQTLLKMTYPFPSDIPSRILDLPSIPDRITQLAAQSNFIIAAGKRSLHYLLLKPEKNRYIYLGENLPTIGIDFDLQIIPATHRHHSSLTVDQADRFKTYQLCMAAANAATAAATQSNHFIHPFFVRYAIRMFDGSIASLSDPILMIPNSGPAPWIRAINTDPKDEVAVLYPSATLCYNVSSPLEFDDWKDLISAIEIYTSKPRFTYDQAREFTEADNTDNPSSEFLTFCKLSEIPSLSIGAIPGYTSPLHKGIMTPVEITADQGYTPDTIFALVAPVDSDKIRQRIADSSTFRLIAEISLDELPSDKSFHPVPIAEGVLAAFDARQPLSELPIAYRSFADASICTYNGRLNVYNANISPALPSLPYAANIATYNPSLPYTTDLLRITVILRTSSYGLCAVSAQFQGQFVAPPFIPWYYYPDSRATEVYFEYATTDIDGGDPVVHKSYRIPLRTHDFLPGAYFLTDPLNIPAGSRCGETEAATPDPLPQSTIPAPASIYLSEALNPLSFSASLVSTVPVTRIHALAAAARPLSQGQFGQYPLYAFTSEGVWALQLSETGSYSARQPISRDVIISPSSILSLDRAVAFLSVRGLMILEGANASCASDPIKAPADKPFDPQNALPFLTEALQTYADPRLLPIPQLRIPANAILCFDHPGQRIIVADPKSDFALIYSLRSKSWGSATLSLRAPLNSYPDALALDRQQQIVSLSQPDHDTPVPVLLITRPFHLSTPDALKTISRAILRGTFHASSLSTILYATRDMNNWFHISSSSSPRLTGRGGTPWTAFRLVVFGTLSPANSISRLSLEFRPRQTRRIR